MVTTASTVLAAISRPPPPHEKLTHSAGTRLAGMVHICVLGPNLRSAGVATHRAQQSRAHDYVRRGRHVLATEPADVIVFLGGDVRWCSLPVTDKPSCEEGRLIRGSCGRPAQVGHRAGRYLHAEFFVEFTCERA